MTVYAIGQIVILGRERYARYVSTFLPILRKHGGRLLAADEAPEVLSGRWPYQKVILLEFPDRAALDRWEASDENREIAIDRIAATEGTILVVRGTGRVEGENHGGAG